MVENHTTDFDNASIINTGNLCVTGRKELEFLQKAAVDAEHNALLFLK